MSKKASQEKLAEIHDLTATAILDIIKNGEIVKLVDKETGEVSHMRMHPSPAMFAQITKFLKDNRIEADLTKSPVGQNLLKNLPFPTQVADEDTNEGAVH